MKASEIRMRFLKFFEKHKHELVPSSSVIPAEDPTILFANAGMNQFKDSFLGKEKRSYKRAVSIQKCIRAGGKHNDLDQVGFTERHLTFFEMMGNFSFGDYFKKEAIEFAWEFLTKELKVSKEKLYPTVFETDDESFKIWRDVIGIPETKITRRGEKENFWRMGDTGPCGPCSEIFFDRGDEFGEHEVDIGGENDRYVEVWNLVFMEYDQQSDGKTISLKQKGVDAGAGFERLACMMQGAENVFDIDIFAELHQAIARLSGKSNLSAKEKIASNVLCDHIRSVCMIVVDGGMPSNEGRGYVLRKIIRRAALFAKKLSDDIQLFSELVPVFISGMSSVYPELVTSEKHILKTIKSELQRFDVNLGRGQQFFSKFVKANEKSGTKKITGEQAFKLYDTYGFPFEITKVLAEEIGFIVDYDGFEKEMAKQKAQSGKGKKSARAALPDVPSEFSTEFVGYDTTEVSSTVLWANENWVVADKTTFYAESGGQVSDSGIVKIDDSALKVVAVVKIGNAIALSVEGLGQAPKKGTKMDQAVEPLSREAITQNHTATHLLQSALKKVVGDHVKQAGSSVRSDQLRFDFNSTEGLTQDQIYKIEQIVNDNVRANLKVETSVTTLKEAEKLGATAFFGEKYNPESVRVVKITDVSIELCGGTHLGMTGDIGFFKITSESAIANGVRRVMAVTGAAAFELIQEYAGIIRVLGEKFKVGSTEIPEVVERLQVANKELAADAIRMKAELMSACVPDLLKAAEEVGGATFIFKKLDGADATALKGVAEELANKKNGLFFLYSTKNDGQIVFVAHRHDDVDQKVFREVLTNHGLRGGGKGNFLQGGGKVDDLDLLRAGLVKLLSK
ncbi:alanine--tRNA ligase [bacterium]|nr:alanine--tRNA ligase [bacterium]